MEELFVSKYGVVGVFILLTIHLLWKVAMFVWELKSKKDSATEDTVAALVEAVDDVTDEMNELKDVLGEVKKLRVDLRRFYSAIKILAGDKWPRIRDEMLKEDFEL